MSRSNGPVTRGGSQAQDWQHETEPDASRQPGASAHHQPYQWPSMAQPQQQYGYPPAYQPDYAAPQNPEPQHAPYHYPQDAGGQRPFSAPAQHPPYFGPQPGQHASPQPFNVDQYGGAHHQLGMPYGHYDNAPAPEPQPYARPYEHYDSQGLAQLQPAGQARRAPQPTLRDQLHAVQQEPWQRPQDPRDYDLGSYMPSDTGGQYGAGPHAGQYDPHWQEHQDYAAHAADPQNSGYYPQFTGTTLPVAGDDQHFDDPDVDDGDDYEYEERGRSRRGLLIVSALVGAVVAGGGLAYAYKTILGPAPKGEPPIIQADSRPAKSQPQDPGGRQFAHSDSKLMGRLESDGASDRTSGSSLSADDSESGGVRRVSTIMVSRDGSITPPPAEPRLPPTTVSVPGMTIVDGFGGRPPMPPTAREAEPVQTASAPSVPRIISKAAPAGSALAAPAIPPPAEERTPPPPMRSAAVQPVTPQQAPERAAPSRPAPQPRQQAATEPAPRSNSVGYVAVLASQKSRIDALKTFADLQQKYNDVLQNKIPDVQEADLSARGLGTMYRVVVGPPGSREAAADLCGQLRSAGFQGCWITAY